MDYQLGPGPLKVDQDEINDELSGKLTYEESGNIGNGIRAFRFGKACFVTFEAFSATTAYSANETLATLPSGFRPAYAVSFLDTLQSTHQRIIITSSGAISSSTAITSGLALRGCVAYIVG